MKVLCVYERRSLGVGTERGRGGVMIEVDSSQEIEDAFYDKMQEVLPNETASYQTKTVRAVYTLLSYLPENGKSRFKPFSFEDDL